MRTIKHALAMMTVGLIIAATWGCGDTLGDSCQSDGDCSDGLTCLSPSCVADKSCQYSCKTDDECVSKAGKGSHCNTADPFGSCIGFCSAAD
ncbi:MAG: hypothetical protein U0270_20525 [Labilithrix sp.]